MDEDMNEAMVDEAAEGATAETKGKRIRRSPQQIIESIDAEIAELEQGIINLKEKKQAAINKFDTRIDNAYAHIEAMQQRKQALLNPKARKRRKTKKEKFEELLTKAVKSGKSLGELEQLLGLHEAEKASDEDSENMMQESEYEESEN